MSESYFLPWGQMNWDEIVDELKTLRAIRDFANADMVVLPIEKVNAIELKDANKKLECCIDALEVYAKVSNWHVNRNQEIVFTPPSSVTVKAGDFTFCSPFGPAEMALKMVRK